MFYTNPLYLCTILLLLIVFAEWLSGKKFFHHLGSSLIVILAAALLANIGVIPSAHNAPPLYEAVFTYIAPLAIFFLLLDVRIKDIRYAGVPMLTMFLTGSACTALATLCSYWLLAPQSHGINPAYAVAGMFAGTYTGGSANLNAVSLQYGVFKNGTLFAAINAVDNIITAIWIVVTLTLPALLQKWFPRQAAKKVAATNPLPVENTHENITVTGFSLLLALGVGTLFLSTYTSKLFPKVPMILILTTLALLLAQIKPLQRVKGGNIIGFLFVLLFLAVVGAYCDIQALVANRQIAWILMQWVTVIVCIHGLLLFVIAGIFKQDWYLTAIASNANIGGPTTAAALATSANRTDLRLPAILVGSIGTVLGTYLGVFIAEYLK